MNSEEATQKRRAQRRLNCQHYLWRETLNFLISPNISIGPTPRVADVGTGTGIWLLDLAKNLPSSAQLEGFDISSTGYPPKEWLPSNVELRLWNVFDEPPEHMHEKYDVVHLRLFLVVVDDNDPSTILRHCLKILKPGGFLQWEEYDLHARTVVTSGSSVPKEHTQRLADFVKRDIHKWVGALPETFASYGLINTSVLRLNENLASSRMFMDVELVLAEEFAANTLDTRGPPGSGDEVRKLAKAVYAEAQQGATIRHILQVVTGRKYLAETEAQNS
ncbi:hypothetical protein MMC27_003129 [Xylographa pallens]|nr:hypothetical protein [Xylographa pallens]